MKWLLYYTLYYLLANASCAENEKKRNNERVKKRDNINFEYNLGRRLSTTINDPLRLYPFFPSEGAPKPNGYFQRNQKSILPPYAVQMEPLIHYSQRDPLYDPLTANLAQTQTNNDLSKAPRDLQADTDRIHETYYGAHQTTKHYIERPVYIKEPEPIIEIIIKDANTTSSSAPVYVNNPPKRKKEEVQVFYVKYKKNPDGTGKNSIIYDKPVPALSPVRGEQLDDHEDFEDHHQQHQEIVYPTSAPVSTTIRAIIKPDSETYHADTGIHVTFGGSSHNPRAETYSHDDDLVESAPQPAVSRPGLPPGPPPGHPHFQQEYKVEQRAPQPYRPFNFNAAQSNSNQQQFKSNSNQQQFKSNSNQPQFKFNYDQLNIRQERPFFQQPQQQQPQQHRPYHQPEFSFDRPQTHFPTLQTHQQSQQNHFFQPSKFAGSLNGPITQQLPHSHHQSVPFNRHQLPHAISHQTNFAEPVRFGQNFNQNFNPNFNQNNNQQPIYAPIHHQNQQQQHQQQQPQQQQQQQQPQQHQSQYFNHPRPVSQNSQHSPQLPPQRHQSTIGHTSQYHQPIYQTINEPPHSPHLSQRQPPVNVKYSSGPGQSSLPSPQNFNAFTSQRESQMNFANTKYLQEPITKNVNTPYIIPPGGELIQSLPKFEQHISINEKYQQSSANVNNQQQNFNFTNYYDQQQQQQPSRPTIKNYVTSPSPILQSFSPQTTTTTPAPKPETTTLTNLKDLNIELPDEVPDELRNQLLSSGILKNAQISVLDYDKVGDIPLSALPPDQLANFYGAGGAQQLQQSGSEIKQTIVKPDESPVKSTQPMELKVVHYDPKTQAGKDLRNGYINENATQIEPVVLNDETYNKYLPLKVSGAQFPVPDLPQLQGKRINSVVVLAPIDYNFYKQSRSTRNANREIELVKNAALRKLVQDPSAENYEQFLRAEGAKNGNMQAVVLLVTNDENREIFMYDIKTKSANRLEGQLSKAFVDAAVANYNEEEESHPSRKDIYYVEPEKPDDINES